MDVTFIRSIAELGLGPLIAIIIIYWNRIDAKEREIRQRTEAETRLLEAKERAQQERDDKLLLIGALRDVAETVGELKAPIAELKILLQKLNGHTSNCAKS